ncbi:MAG TPA: hypothetical protein VL443_08325 [Cyclobacteriaceae bacterium]|jgi:hypothetical protein|nr:hypothetical protein [Cyclobacteriaceae bacterium]
MSNTPNTPAIMSAIQGYMQNIIWGNNQQFSLVQVEEIKDVTNYVSKGSACLEIYGTSDDSQHLAFGGKITDQQSFLLMALVSKDKVEYAQQIYAIRDAIVVPFQAHATLGNAGTVYHSQIKPGTGAYIDVIRNQQWLRGYRVQILTRQEWNVPVPPGVIS